MGGTKSKGLRLRPIVQVPRKARPGETYLMTVDLESTHPEEWPYEREEYNLTLNLETMPLFEHEIIGEPTLTLHRFGGTYGEVRYLLRASETEASGDIKITLISEVGLPVDVISLSEIHVEEAAPEDSTAYAQLEYQKEFLRQETLKSGTVGRSFVTPVKPIDLIIRVSARRDGPERILEYRLHSPSGLARGLTGETHQSHPLGSPDALRQNLLREFERLRYGAVQDGKHLTAEVYTALTNLGHSLYDLLFPDSMREAYRGFRDQVQTLLVVSDDSWIPWELVRPYEDDREDDFFCMQFEMSRWLTMAGDPVVVKGIRQLLCFTSGEMEDQAALSEVEDEFGILTAVATSHAGVEGSVLRNPSFEDLNDRLIGGVDLLHFAGHSLHRESSTEDTELAGIELADRPLLARGLVGKPAAQLRRDRPIVVLNACQSGRLGWSLTGLGGWAQSWIEDYGASAFLAPVLSVKDTAAREFATVFYRELQEGKTAGSALRTARRELRAKDEMAWLTYSLYAHPNLRVEFGEDIVEPVSVDEPQPPLILPELRWRPDRSPPGALLRSEYAVVPFHLRQAELEDLEAWCRSGDPLGVRLYTGAGGMGKTRLALEICRRLRADGWQAGLVDPARLPEEMWRNLVLIGAPRLLIVDYAETQRPLLVPLLRDIYRSKDDVPIRVLLLARAASDWWEQLKAEGGGVGELLSGPATRWYTLQPLAFSIEDRADSYKIAAEAFAERLGKKMPAEVPEDLESEHYGRAALLHMSALAAIDGVVVKDEDGILDYVLERERRFWREHAVERHLAPEVVVGIGRAMAAITLGGGVNGEEQAVLALRRLAFFKDEKESVLTMVARLLRGIYPGENRWIEPVMPNLLGEHLIMRELEVDSGDLLSVVFSPGESVDEAEIEPLVESVKSGESESVRESLVRLNRLAQRRHGMVVWLANALKERLEDVAEVALDVAVETGDPIGQIIANILEDRIQQAPWLQTHMPLVEKLFRRLPEHSVALSELARVLTGQLLDWEQSKVGGGDPERIAFLTNYLAARLGALGWWEDAVETAHNAVRCALRLPENHSKTEYRLATARANLARGFSELGRRQEALDAIREAVELFRRLTANRAKTYWHELADVLVLQARILREVGRRKEAFEVAQEAVDLYQTRASMKSAHWLGLAMALEGLAKYEGDLGQWQQALAHINEAVDVYRQLCRSRPEAYRPMLAVALNQMAVHLSATGQFHEAASRSAEAVATCRHLAAARPDVFEPTLAALLNDLAARLREVGDREAAVEVVIEAAVTYRRLAMMSFPRFGPLMAASLSNLAAMQRETGQLEEATKAAEEAIEIYRELVSREPDAFNEYLAGALNNLAMLRSELQQKPEAVAAGQEAAGFFRRLASRYPARFRPDLASSLSNLSVLLDNVDRTEEATDTAREAIEILQRLVENPDHGAASLPHLAMALNNISRCLRQARRDEALQAAQKSVRLYRSLVEERPAALRHDLAMALNTLASRLSENSRHAKAIDVAREGVTEYRSLAARHPDAFLPKVAIALANLTACVHKAVEEPETFRRGAEAYRSLAADLPSRLHHQLATGLNEIGLKLKDLGLNEEALAVTREAVGLYRHLVEDHPGSYEAQLALSLNNQSVRFRHLGRVEESLGSSHEAVNLFRDLIKDQADTVVPYLAPSLHNLALALRDLGRMQEALEASEEGARLLAPLFLHRPAEFRAWMDEMVSDYRKIATAAVDQPDEEFLAPVEAALQETRTRSE